MNFTIKPAASAGQPAMMDYVPRECKRGLYFNYVDKVFLKNVTLTGYEGDRITAINVGEVTEE